MILFLDQPANRKGEPNENYARELMELFTLGADRGAYTETDVRELARSLTGWRYDRSQRARRAQLPLGRAEPLGPRLQDRVRQARRAGRGRTPARMVVEHPQAPVVLRRQALELLHPDAARRGDGGRSSRRSTRARATRSARCSRRSSARPQLYEGAADGQAADRAVAGHAARPQARRSPTALGLRRAPAPASASTTRRTSRAGTTSAGSTPTPRSGAGGGRRTRSTATPRIPARTTYPAETPEPGGGARRARSGATRTSPPPASPRCSTSRSGAIPSDAASWLRAQRQNALRQLIAGSPDYQTS